MSKRSLRKPLYELMTARRDRSEGSDETEPAAPMTFAPWLVVGRTVRLPVGYLLLAAAAVLLLLVCVYMIGHWRGGQAQKAQFDEALLASGAAGDPAGRPRDPLTLDGGREGPGGSTASPSGSSGGVSPTAPVGAAIGSGAAAWGPIESDPRQPGRCYMVLVTTRPAGAIRLAEFCREHGLEAYVIRGNNDRLRRVIVLPGTSTHSRSDPEVRRLMEQVDPVCRLWRDEHPGEGDLQDRFMLPPYQP